MEHVQFPQMKTLKALLTRALFWGILYLLTIPAFAAIFHFMLPAGSFFHATLPHEPLVQAKSQMVLEKYGPSTRMRDQRIMVNVKH